MSILISPRPKRRRTRRGTARWLCLAATALAALSLCGPGRADPSVNPTIRAPHGVPATVVSPLGGRLSLKFDDEFTPVKDTDGQPYIDRTKWQTTFWQGTSQRTLPSNGEAEYYLDKDDAGTGALPPGQRVNPFSFETPGVLTIAATRVPEAYWADYGMSKERCFASGLLISDKRFSFEHGYVEGRFKLPPNRGTWPAFWLLGDDPAQPTPEAAHRWPPEVDIFEFFGHRPTKHSSGVIPLPGEQTAWKFGIHDVGTDLTKAFHTWAFAWDAHRMVWLLDGKVWAQTDTPPSLNRPMYLLINLAVGGNWYSQEMTAAKTPAQPWEVDESTMPWKMECDYVRVYQ